MNYITKANVGFKSEILGFGRVFDSLSPRDYDNLLLILVLEIFSFLYLNPQQRRFCMKGIKRTKGRSLGPSFMPTDYYKRVTSEVVPAINKLYLL